MGSGFLLSLFFGSLMASQSAMAATVVGQDRGTFARSHIVHAPDFREDVQASETRTFGAFEAFDTSDAYLPPSIATSSAWLDSRIGTRRAQARGGATSILVVPESDRLVETPADSFFELIFGAEEGEPFRLEGQVDALAFAAEAFASVELVRLADDAIVAEHVAFGGEYDRFDDTGTLAAGRHRLTAFALSYGEVGGGLVGGGDVGGDISSPAALASFRAVFLVPEPSSGTGAAVALLVLVRLAKARRRSS